MYSLWFYYLCKHPFYRERSCSKSVSQHLFYFVYFVVIKCLCGYPNQLGQSLMYIFYIKMTYIFYLKIQLAIIIPKLDQAGFYFLVITYRGRRGMGRREKERPPAGSLPQHPQWPGQRRGPKLGTQTGLSYGQSPNLSHLCHLSRSALTRSSSQKSELGTKLRYSNMECKYINHQTKRLLLKLALTLAT